MYAGNHLGPRSRTASSSAQEVVRAMEDEMLAANRGAVTTKGFELEAARMGRLMRDQYNVGFVDVGGWDTHVNEGGAHGHARDQPREPRPGPQDLRRARSAGEWTQTVVLVVSEFGRTFRENGNGGTDHGHGSVYWALGGGLRGGRVAGEQVRVAAATLFQDRDYPVLNNYRVGPRRPVPAALGPVDLAAGARFPSAEPIDLGLV